MSFTYRENQNTPLTWAQLDGNFREVENVQREVSTQVMAAAASAESATAASAASQSSAELAEEMARISVVRWCGNSTTPPTTRLDGSPLEISDEYGNLTDNLRYNWTGTSWIALNSSAQQLEVALASPGGTNKIGFERSKLGAAVSALSKFLSAKKYSIWEFDYAITDRSNPDPSKWDWSQAGKEALPKTRDGVLIFPSFMKYRFASMVLVPVNAEWWTNIFGSTGEGTVIVLDPGIPTAFAYDLSVPGDMIRKIRIGGFAVDASQTDGTDGAIIFGGRQNRIEPKGLSYEDIQLFDLRHFGASSDTSGGNFRIGIQMSSIFNTVDDAPATMKYIHIDRCRFDGGITGIYAGAGVPNSNNAPLWIDEFYITDFYHDSLIPDAGYPAAGIQVGQDSRGGRLRITRAYSHNSGDVGIEHNGFLDPILEDCHLFNPGSGFWSYNYHELDNYKEQRVIWRDCSVTNPRKNPAWRIGQNRGGHFLLERCAVYLTEESDPRVLDFSASMLQGLESLTIKDLKIYVTTKAKIDYINLAAAFSLGANFAEYALNIDGLDIYYDGVAPKEAHECAALIINSTAPGALVRANIKNFRVHDKRTGTLKNSDGIRVYGTAKVVGTISDMLVDSTVALTLDPITGLPIAGAAKRGLRVENSATPAPELKIRDSDLSGCTSGFELSTAVTDQRNNVLWDNVTFNKKFDVLTQPSSPTVSAGDYLYKNIKGMTVRAIVSGGTVSAISISQDGTTFFPYGVVAGEFMVMPNETLKISSTVSPQLRLLVLVRLTSL